MPAHWSHWQQRLVHPGGNPDNSKPKTRNRALRALACISPPLFGRLPQKLVSPKRLRRGELGELDLWAFSDAFFSVTIAAESTTLERWESLCDDSRFHGLPYKIETDENGRIVMSPTKNYLGFFASRINRLLEHLMSGGTTGNEIGIITSKGVKVPDSVWASEVRFSTIFSESASSIAPEICVEILSDANTPKEFTEKSELYFRAGAQEVWTCDAQGTLRFFAPKGELRRSAVCPKFPKSIGPK